MVSHELRTPLTSINGSTAAVLGATREFGLAETREFFRIVDEQAERMFGLITDLMDAGLIDAGTLSVAPEPTEVARASWTDSDGAALRGRRHGPRLSHPPQSCTSSRWSQGTVIVALAYMGLPKR